jgi:hypothetical protein
VVVVVAAAATVAAVAAADMAAAVAAADMAAAIVDRAKRPIQFFRSKSARFHSSALFVNSFLRSGCKMPMMRLSIEPRRAYGEGEH